MIKLDNPLNAQEKYLYGINVRLEVLIEQLSSICELLGKQSGVTVETGKVEEVQVVKQVKQNTRTRKG